MNRCPLGSSLPQLRIKLGKNRLRFTQRRPRFNSSTLPACSLLCIVARNNRIAPSCFRHSGSLNFYRHIVTDLLDLRHCSPDAIATKRLMNMQLEKAVMASLDYANLAEYVSFGTEDFNCIVDGLIAKN